MQRVRIYVCSNIVIHGRTDFSNYVRTRDTRSSIASIKYAGINTKKKNYLTIRNTREIIITCVCVFARNVREHLFVKGEFLPMKIPQIPQKEQR